MTDLPEFDDRSWCAERRVEVAHYIQTEALPFGRVSEEPSWFVAPYISIWSVEDAIKPGWPGAWVICGDLPTDFVRTSAAASARDALRELARRWLEVSESMARGEMHAEYSIGTPDDWPMLSPILRSRAELLDACADDAELWPEV